MARKKITDKSAWKPVRVKKEWLELIRWAHKKNPEFSPTFDLADASEPHLLHVACQIASLYISGWFWDRLEPDIDRIVDLARVEAAVSVATHLGAAISKNPDGTLTITKPDHADGMVPKPLPMQRPTMIN